MKFNVRINWGLNLGDGMKIYFKEIFEFYLDFICVFSILLVFGYVMSMICNLLYDVYWVENLIVFCNE